MTVAVVSPFLPTRDPRTESWFLLGDLKLLVTMLACYVYLVSQWYPGIFFIRKQPIQSDTFHIRNFIKCPQAKKGIPMLMEGRKPMKLVLATRIYSFIMTSASVYFLMRTLPRTYFGGGYSFVCQGELNNQRESHSDAV